ncbi:MAG: hypothetical protein JNL54_04200 [Kineosporiaceae bacterium]|nr:hypothetical protein [Kineosporiaceae bacterium]
MDDDELMRRSEQVLRGLAEDLPGVHPRIASARRENALDELSAAVLEEWLVRLGDEALARLRALIASDPTAAGVRAFVQHELPDHARVAREALARRSPPP